MTSIQEIAEEIVAREGGFVNDPDDLGGATNFGVTIHTMRRLGLDLDQDGDIDVSDVRKLTRSQAVDIFIRHYFERPNIATLPQGLQPSVFDMYVNAGAQAVMILQRLLKDMGWSEIAVDGVIGPQTARIAHEADAKSSRHLYDGYGIARRNYYYRIADRRPANRKFATRRDGRKGGWIRRAEEFISPKYHLTQAQHLARTKGWL